MGNLALWPFALAACTVGPEFQPPSPAMPAGWAGVPRPEAPQPAGASVAVVAPPDLVRWWTIFNDPLLTSLIERAATANPGVVQAEARLRQARAARGIVAADQSPDVTASAGASRARAGGRTGNLFRAGFDAGWEIDVFGGIRRSVEAADAGVVAAVEDQRDVLVSLIAEVATTYYDLRGAQLELAIAQRNLDAQRQSLELTRERLRGGYISALDVANAESAVAGTTSRIPSLESTIRQSIYALGVLLGREPGALLPELSAEAPLPATPPRVPVGLPSELLRRRPDVRRAEASLHAATARVGVATADLFPRFSLTGSFGFSGDTVGRAASLSSRSWSIGPAVSWPVFDAGRIRSNIAGQRAAADETYSLYQQTVLTALQDVENALVAFDHEQARREALAQAVEADRRAVDLATQLYTAGRTDFLNVLSAQRSLLDAESSLSQSSRLVITNLIALYKALGGGWEGPVQPPGYLPGGDRAPNGPAPAVGS